MVDKVRGIAMKHWYVGEGRGAKPVAAAVLETLKANGFAERAEHLVKTDASVGRIVMDASNALRKLIKSGRSTINIIDHAGATFEYAVEAPAAKPAEETVLPPEETLVSSEVATES